MSSYSNLISVGCTCTYIIYVLPVHTCAIRCWLHVHTYIHIHCTCMYIWQLWHWTHFVVHLYSHIKDFMLLAREIHYVTNFRLIGCMQRWQCNIHTVCAFFFFLPCSFPGADDNTLFQKFERQHKNHPHYRSPQLKQQDPQFTILHYASEVTYSVKVCMPGVPVVPY